MLKLAVIDLADTGAVQILAWKQAKIVRKVTARASMAIVGQSKFAKLILLLISFDHRLHLLFLWSCLVLFTLKLLLSFAIALIVSIL